MNIYSDNSIEIDGAATGLYVKQSADGTIVYSSGGARTMPHGRYALSHNAPASGVPGRAQFEADIRALMGATK